MNKLNRTLNTVRNVVITFFIVRSIFYIWDFIAHPEVYEAQSAPWYTGILLLGILTLGVVVVCAVIKAIFKRKVENPDD
jgi:hypothetical protein